MKQTNVLCTCEHPSFHFPRLCCDDFAVVAGCMQWVGMDFSDTSMRWAVCLVSGFTGARALRRHWQPAINKMNLGCRTGCLQVSQQASAEARTANNIILLPPPGSPCHRLTFPSWWHDGYDSVTLTARAGYNRTGNKWRRQRDIGRERQRYTGKEMKWEAEERWTVKRSGRQGERYFRMDNADIMNNSLILKLLWGCLEIFFFSLGSESFSTLSLHHFSLYVTVLLHPGLRCGFLCLMFYGASATGTFVLVWGCRWLPMISVHVCWQNN